MSWIRSFQRLLLGVCERIAAASLDILNGLAFLLLLLLQLEISAATLPAGFAESVFAGGLSAPTAMAFTPDGRLFVTQQGGALRVIKNGALLPTPFVTVTTTSSGERGLLGVAIDPGFASNHFVYVYYTATSPAVHNRVSRFTANGDVAVAGSELVIFELDNLSGATNHNGGALHFGPDGKLYFAAGENANPANAQTIGNVLGKIMRINSDGTIPADNPSSFPGISGTPTGKNRAIWSVGLRNPYTFTFQPITGRMFINDVGQNTWEEINDGIAGSNYGWNICEGFCSPPNGTHRDPLFEYGHGSSTTTGCAITGGVFYNPAIRQFPADYVGKYFFADFCSGWIRRFDPATGTATGFATGISAPLDLLVGPDGNLYYLANGTGTVVRVRYTLSTNSAFDYDGDAKSDISVFRPSTGTWFIQRSQAGLYGQSFGVASDKITPADYDGDGKTDIAVYRPSTGIWYIVNSGNGTVSFDDFGIAEDLPTPADYDGDGKADLSVFRPSIGIWYHQNSSNGLLVGVQFGTNGDKPIVGNFDGDGKADVAVFRPSTGIWYWKNSSDALLTGVQFGLSSDLVVPADYDGDGKTDVAIFRPSTANWYVRNSATTEFTADPFGAANDIPAPADFDGDGKADRTVFRPSDGNWYRQNSSNGMFFALHFGANADRPTESAFRY
jgi:glucose/arabinose dehydrogenase